MKSAFESVYREESGRILAYRVGRCRSPELAEDALQVRHAAMPLGTWRSIIFAEFDGPRSRSLAVRVSGV